MKLYKFADLPDGSYYRCLNHPFYCVKQKVNANVVRTFIAGLYDHEGDPSPSFGVDIEERYLVNGPTDRTTKYIYPFLFGPRDLEDVE